MSNPRHRRSPDNVRIPCARRIIIHSIIIRGLFHVHHQRSLLQFRAIDVQDRDVGIQSRAKAFGVYVHREYLSGIQMNFVEVRFVRAIRQPYALNERAW